jgi:transcriptional regulator with XRE-family HTH domain
MASTKREERRNEGGRALDEWLKATGKKQSDVEALLKLGGGYVSHLIAGRHKPGWGVRVKLHKAAKISQGAWDIKVETEGSKTS